VAVVVKPPPWRAAWPLAVFHLFLLVNTFYSIRTFATLIPSSAGQWAFDIALGVCIALGPLAFDHPMDYTILMLALFILATYKYILAIPLAGFSKLLFRKIVIDMLGVAGTFAVLVAMWQGFVFPATVVGVAAFAVVNVYILWLNPLYRFDVEPPKQGFQHDGRFTSAATRP